MKTRVISLLIALCLLVGLIPAVSAETVASGTCGENLTWRYDETIDTAWGLIYDTLYIEGEGAMYDYMLDENGKTTAPWRDLYYNTIVIDSGVTYIGEYAFYGITPGSLNLYKSDVTGIGSHAFASDTNCGRVLLPAGLTRIEDNLFLNDSALTQVYIPEGVVSIGNSSFSGTAVTNLIVPEVVSSVGGNAFEGMPGPIWFTGNVPAFAADTFSNYTGTVYYPADDPAWAEAAAKNSDGTWAPAPVSSGTCGENLTWTLNSCTLYIEGEGDMYDYNYYDAPAPWAGLSFVNLEIGPGVTSIGNDAFWSCKDLIFTNLGESNVRRIGTGAFAYTRIFQETVPEGVTVLENSVFFGTS